MKTTRKHGPDSQISLLDIATKLPLNTDFTSKEFGVYTGFKAISCAPKVRQMHLYGWISRNKEKNRFVKYRMNKKQQDAMIKKYNETYSKTAKLKAKRAKKIVSEKEMLLVIDEAKTMYCESILRKAKLI